MKKLLYIFVFLLVALVALFAALHFFVDDQEENAWFCENGTWVRHGDPDQDHSTAGCSTQTDTMKKDFEYTWSTMNEGPYTDSITFATSTNLTSWYPSGKILATHASVPGAVKKNEKIFVYFVDVTEDGAPEQTGLVLSEDNGRTWTNAQRITIEGIGDRVVADPDPVLLDDGRIRLYYFDINESRLYTGEENTAPPQRIYSAISDDGVHFIQENGVRFTRDGAFDPDVERDGDTWRMYVGTPDGQEVISATSTDGLNFYEEGVAFTGGAVPDVFHASNIWYLFTSGIHIATSEDGKTFTSTKDSFHATGVFVTADPSVIGLATGKYLMIYKTH